MHLKELCKKSHQNAKDHGFWDKDRNVGELLMLIVSELGEALEAHRSGDIAVADNDQTPVNKTMIEFCMDMENVQCENWKKFYELTLKNCFETEIADTFIRLADLCAGLNIDIEKFIMMKMMYNKTRSKMHGKAY